VRWVDSTVTLAAFLDRQGPTQRTLSLVNRTEPEQYRSMLESTFERQSVAVTEYTAPEHPENTVVLLDDAGRELATSSLERVGETLLLTNSDAFITGSTSLEAASIPDVLTGLDGVRFALRGYPQSHKEKLLLIGLSRHIERVAWTEGDGTLWASFQKLSRLDDERGTRRAYERLVEAGVDVHLYGVASRDTLPDIEATIHTGTSEAYTDSWFVVYQPDAVVTEADDDTAQALVALQDDDGRWDGAFTRDPAEVTRLGDYISSSL
jgi:hypothetical protein